MEQDRRDKVGLMYVELIPCSQYRTSMFGGMDSFLSATCSSNVVFPILDKQSTVVTNDLTSAHKVQLYTHPLGPTRPYLLPAVICSEALTNKSLPRAERENLSILMSWAFSKRASLTRVSRCETENWDSSSSNCIFFRSCS